MMKTIDSLERVLLMASITPKRKSGRIVSYKFKTCVGRNTQGKQIFRCTTWVPPEGMKVFQADRAAEKAALEWEDTARAEYEREMAALAAGKSYSLPPEKRHDDFNSFVSEIWLPPKLLIVFGPSPLFQVPLEVRYLKSIKVNAKSHSLCLLPPYETSPDILRLVSIELRLNPYKKVQKGY